MGLWVILYFPLLGLRGSYLPIFFKGFKSSTPLRSEFLSLGAIGAAETGQTGQSDAALALNDDDDDDEQANCIALAAPAAAAAWSEADDVEEVEPDVVADLSSQFPNAIIVHGLKHVADGALGHTLQSMNLYLECISGGRGQCQFIAMPA